MFKKILQSMTIASLLWGGYALSDAGIATSAAVPLDVEFTQNPDLISNSLSFDKFDVTIKAKKHVNLSLLVPKSKDSRSDQDKFLADFQAVRQAKYPNEEIELIIRPKAMPEKFGDSAPTASGRVYMALVYRFNIYLSYNKAYGWAYTAYKGVAATLHVVYGSVRLDIRQGSYYYNYGTSSSLVGGYRSGYQSAYGARGVCRSSSCKFDLVTFFPY